MLTRQNPFSFYDFLGYFIPGAITFYVIIFAYFHSNTHDFGMSTVSKTILLFDKNFYLPFIIASYILGHLLSFVSSITIEKYANWSFGYPSKYLLEIAPDGFFKPKSAKVRRIFGRIVVALTIFPVVFFDILLGLLMNLRELYIKPAGKASVSVMKNSIAKIFSNVINQEIPFPDSWFEKESFFRFCYHYALENAPNHNQKMQNYVALFGFTRTLTFIFVLFFWLFAWHTIEGRMCPKLAYFLILFSGSVGYIFFIAFNKFYRRYCLEALMAASTAVYSNKNDIKSF